VDGTLLKGLPLLMQAAAEDPRAAKYKAKWRLHFQFEVERYIPTEFELTAGAGRGKADERAVLERMIEPGRCYVKDRGYAKFALFNAIHGKNSNYVCRLRDNSNLQVLEERPLMAEDVEAGVLQDALVGLGLEMKAAARPDHPVRLIVVRCTPHEKRGKTAGGSAGPASSDTMLIATDMLDVPAWIIALLYQYRWTIEIFFRFFKHILGCRHLLSHDPVGIKIQTYCAIIVCMLISLWTGRKPTLRTLLLHRLDRRGGTAGPFGQTSKTRNPVVPPGRSSRRGGVSRCALVAPFSRYRSLPALPPRESLPPPSTTCFPLGNVQ
jgi:hypothetical protein